MSQFNALTGPELKRYLLTKIEEELDKSDKFGNHLTHPWIKYSFEVSISTYPQEAQDANPKVVAKGGEVLNDQNAIHDDLDANEPVVEVLKSSGVVDTPDKARVESNQPIPTTVKGPGDVLVDKPVQVKFPAKKDK